MDYPKLRSNVEVIPAQVSNRRGFYLRDTLNVTDKLIFLPMEAMIALRLFNGRNSLLDIQASFTRNTGELVYKEDIERLVQQLDEALFLEGETFEAHKGKLLNDFKASPFRAALLAGKSYPDDPDKLRGELKGYFDDPQGPGDGELSDMGETIRAAVIPHIDFARGGPTYAWAYREMMARPPADLYIILGTAHVPTEGPYVLTSKDFETPLGMLKTDQELAALLAEAYGPDIFTDELVHRSEHSVELQAVFLKYALGDDNDATILPVLCGSFHQFVTEGKAPREDTQVEKLTTALKEYISGSGKKVCIIASADLAHMGPRFGDKFPVVQQQHDWMAGEDAELARIVEACDSEGFFLHIARDRDKRRICGFPPIYTMLQIIEPSRGKLLKYSQWPDEEATVTFASMIFT